MRTLRKVAQGMLVAVVSIGLLGGNYVLAKDTGKNVKQPSAVFFPANNANNICVDTLLKITFDGEPTVGTGGMIKICKAVNDQVVDTINLANPTMRIVSSSTYTVEQLTTRLNLIGTAELTRVVNYNPVIKRRNTVIIVPHNNKLEYNTTYYVTIEPGIFAGTINQKPFNGITKKGVVTWKFSTRKAAPHGAVLTVSDNGLADFCTIQGALDHIPAANTTPYTINIKPGIYEEMLYIRGKQNITLRGAGREKTIIQYDNCDSFNNGTGGGTPLPLSPTTVVKRGGRSIVLVEAASGLVIDNLTIRSTHPQNSAASNQAETIYLNGSSTDRYIVKNSSFTSYQDTLQMKANVWFYNCYISGDVDFIWGSPTVALFEKCELKSRYNEKSGGYLVQARVAKDTKGFVFLNCTLTREENTAGTFLARSAQTSGANANYYDNVAFINCKMDSHIEPAGWQLWTSPAGPNPATASAVNGWKEYKNMDLNGNLLNTVARLTPGSYQLTDAEFEAGFRDRGTILGGWNPQP